MKTKASRSRSIAMLTYAQARSVYLQACARFGMERLAVANKWQLPMHPFGYRMVKDGFFTVIRLSVHKRSRKSSAKAQTYLVPTPKAFLEHARLSRIATRRRRRLGP